VLNAFYTGAIAVDADAPSIPARPKATSYNTLDMSTPWLHAAILTGVYIFFGGGRLTRSCLPVFIAFIFTELGDEVCTEAEETFEHKKYYSMCEVGALGQKKELSIEHVIQRNKT